MIGRLHDSHSRIALVTGGARGIGRAIVERLAFDGYSIAVHSGPRSRERGDDVVRRLSTEYPGALFRSYTSDFATGQIDFLDGILADFGHIHVLVNNAGRVSDIAHDAVTLQELDALFRINYFVPQLLTSRVFGIMKNGSWGRIVNLSSAATHFGMGRNLSIHYASSKAALDNLTVAFARLGAPHGITANSVAPGVVDTEVQRGRTDLGKRIDLVPMGRMAQVSEVADAVGYLVSDSAAFVTGQVFCISGGE